jgi:hypothetical protein
MCAVALRELRPRPGAAVRRGALAAERGRIAVAANESRDHPRSRRRGAWHGETRGQHWFRPIVLAAAVARRPHSRRVGFPIGSRSTKAHPVRNPFVTLKFGGEQLEIEVRKLINYESSFLFCQTGTAAIEPLGSHMCPVELQTSANCLHAELAPYR